MSNNIEKIKIQKEKLTAYLEKIYLGEDYKGWVSKDLDMSKVTFQIKYTTSLEKMFYRLASDVEDISAYLDKLLKHRLGSIINYIKFLYVKKFLMFNVNTKIHVILYPTISLDFKALVIIYNDIDSNKVPIFIFTTDSSNCISNTRINIDVLGTDKEEKINLFLRNYCIKVPNFLINHIKQLSVFVTVNKEISLNTKPELKSLNPVIKFNMPGFLEVDMKDITIRLNQTQKIGMLNNMINYYNIPTKK